MAEKKPWYNDKGLRKLQREWYARLKDDGFFDIEGGVEGHLLQGGPSSVSLLSFANTSKSYGGLKQPRGGGLRGRFYREFSEVAADEEDLLNFSEGGKARYFHHASLLAAQAIREGRLPAELCYAWAFHSLGEGERVIADMLEVSRAKIRKHLAVLRKNILRRLDNEYT